MIKNLLNCSRGKNDKKHHAIVKAAKKLFLCNGFGCTSMDNAAKEAGVSKQTIYAHFGNKETLFKEVMASMCCGYECPLKTMDKKKISAEQALYDLAYSFAEFIFSKDAVSLKRVVVGEAKRSKKLAQTFYDNGPEQSYSNLTEFFKYLHKTGEYNFPHPRLAAEQFISLILGNVHFRLVLGVTPKPNKDEIKEHLDYNVETFIRAHKVK
jgi:TetR/AcrR family transcriptional repressor of mexJK operon